MTMLSRDTLKQIKKLKSLSSVSLRLIPFLGVHTDLDRRIYTTINHIEAANIMTPCLIKPALENLKEVGLIYDGGDGYLYSNFSTTSTAENHNFHYINLYRFLVSNEFKKTYKRQLQFLFYILTAKLPGHEHSIAIEHLYQNRSNAKGVKLDFFISFEDMVTNLLGLINKGFFEVRLGANREILNKNTENLKEKLYKFAEKTGKRKKRISYKEEKHHIIHIRIAKNLVSQDQICNIYEMTRLSTLQDLKSIAKNFGCSLDSFSIKALEKVHMVKAKIHKQFGNVGIQLYREGLEDFFNNRNHAFQGLMESGEFGNTIKNFYVIPRIKKRILSMFEQVKNDYVTQANKFPYHSLNLKQAFNKSKAFISYLLDEAYNDNLIILDRELEAAYSDIYKELIQIDKTWYELHQRVEKIYSDESKTYGNNRNRVFYLALQKELSQKERGISDTEQDNIFRNERLLHNPYVATPSN